MKVDAALLKKLDLSSASARVTTSALDRLPLLISERSLTNSTGRLARSISADFSSGSLVSSTTFSMPRKGFGPRPVTALSGRDRALYDALVEHLRPSLPTESRSRENWTAFREFGLPGTTTSAKYIVTLDIASMYEYVDHDILKRELLVQTLDSAPVMALVDLLGEAFAFPRGIPQMMQSSDLLGDVYIGVLERDLLRDGYQLMRYADDFRVPANDWGTAHRIIERAAEAARAIGLVLSSEKTTIQLATTLAEEESQLQAVFAKYFASAVEDLTTFDDVMDWYGEVSTVEIAPDEQVAMHEAFHRVISDWTKPRKDPFIPPRLVAKSIQSLGKAVDRISDEVLIQTVWQDPLRLSSVVAYMHERPDETTANWKSLRELVAMERQSPWAKLWLLSATDGLTSTDTKEASDALEDVYAWVKAQLRDPHEVVRAEAAWTLAGRKLLTPREVSALFGSATRITRTGLAAALGRSGAAATDSIVRSIIGSSPLYKDALEWGGTYDASSAQ